MADIIAAHWAMLLGLAKQKVNKKILLLAGTGAVCFRFIYSFYQRHKLRKRLSEKKEILKIRMDSFRETVSSYSNLVPLVDSELADLRQQLKDGTIKPTDLLHAFQAKAMQLYDEGNSGICEFILQANSFAKKVESGDEEITRSPLYGIPVSIKETLAVTGYDSTCGLIKFCNAPNTHCSVLFQVLLKCGAVPFVLTYTSQGCRTIDGYNPIFGTLTNPFKKSCFIGGSSCGEAALIAQRGSPVGIGTDIGGSIRIPAVFCGLVSLKPTTNRLSSSGLVSVTNNSTFDLLACPGPMGRNVEDIADVMRSLLTPTMFNLDHRVIPKPFDEFAYNGDVGDKLVIGFYDNLSDFGLMQTVPSVKEAVSDSVNTLALAGHRLVGFAPPNPLKAFRLYLRCLFVDGGRELRSVLANEPIGEQLRMLYSILLLPNWMKSIGDATLTFIGCKPMSIAHTLGGLRNASALLELGSELRAYRKEFEKAWNKSEPLDALVCPASAYPAPPCSTKSLFITPSIVYCALYNLVDYPAGTVPTGFVDEVNILQTKQFGLRKHLEGSWYTSRVASLQNDSEGLPVGVQVVAKPFQEEIVLRVMKIIESKRA